MELKFAETNEADLKNVLERTERRTKKYLPGGLFESGYVPD